MNAAARATVERRRRRSVRHEHGRRIEGPVPHAGELWAKVRLDAPMVGLDLGLVWHGGRHVQGLGPATLKRLVPPDRGRQTAVRGGEEAPKHRQGTGQVRNGAHAGTVSGSDGAGVAGSGSSTGISSGSISMISRGSPILPTSLLLPGRLQTPTAPDARRGRAHLGDRRSVPLAVLRDANETVPDSHVTRPGRCACPARHGPPPRRCRRPRQRAPGRAVRERA